MQFKVDMPYPEVKVMRKDMDLAKKIFNLYAGSVSEDTCIHSYLFQMMLINDKELKKIFREIAIVEMHHLEILGMLIKKLGFNPIFVSFNEDKTKWFSGEYVNYEKEYRKMLISDIENEKKAIKSYEKVISFTEDENVKHILKRIVLDECLHVEILSKLYKQVS